MNSSTVRIEGFPQFFWDAGTLHVHTRMHYVVGDSVNDVARGYMIVLGFNLFIYSKAVFSFFL